MSTYEYQKPFKIPGFAGYENSIFSLFGVAAKSIWRSAKREWQVSCTPEQSPATRLI
ncbi:conserved hypothetical protein [Ricinus communis]|uniref:Uncharacterized protein n=1 Tax=Ricinus communis TaxID=3988 RepID=B9RN16_RICCO|nr:conserved hypothetical protein [Ricinus communis]